jgi:NAD(P)-dependent dehydrogenase (short-subunit alcohol dehydrogenase family)
MKVAVVGASSGLGRSIAVGLAGRGAEVALLARRRHRLVRAAQDIGNNAVAVACDVTDEQSCHEAITQAAEELGGLDGLVYATGIGWIAPLVKTDAATWARLFATNVTGAALVTAAALPYLAASTGTAVYLSSISASLTPPWPHVAAYGTSKAALDKLVEGFRVEHPDVGFTRLAVGDCPGGDGPSASEFIAGFDTQQVKDAVAIWLERGYITGHLIDVADLVAVVDSVLLCGKSSSIPSLTLAARVPGPPIPVEI